MLKKLPLIHNKNHQVINFIEGISKVMSKSPQDVLSQIKDEGIELIDLKFMTSMVNGNI